MNEKKSHKKNREKKKSDAKFGKIKSLLRVIQ